MEPLSLEFSGRASLVALGQWFRGQGIWQEVKARVHMQQKVIRYRPQEKLLDELINMLAGGSGLVEVNTRVRSDLALQRAFARKGCAEQSTIGDTPNACDVLPILEAGHKSQGGD